MKCITTNKRNKRMFGLWLKIRYSKTTIALRYCTFNTGGSGIPQDKSNTIDEGIDVEIFSRNLRSPILCYLWKTYFFELFVNLIKFYSSYTVQSYYFCVNKQTVQFKKDVFKQKLTKNMYCYSNVFEFFYKMILN